MSKNTQSQSYNHLPIKEAIFDLQIRGGNTFNKDLFTDFSTQNTDYVPNGFLQNVNIHTETNNTRTEIFGCRYISQDQKKVVLFKKNGFSFSCIKTYKGWEKSYQQAMEMWKKYCLVIKPTVITRMATRFINQFHIPIAEFTEPKEYFNIYVQYKHSISPIWNQMSCRLLVPHNNGIQSHIMYDSHINQNNQTVDVILDIDVYSDNLAISQKNMDNINRIFNQLRDIKNNIFEKSITDKIREMIK